VRPDASSRSGIGFAKTAEQNWQLLSNIAALNTIGYPGVDRRASRKAAFALCRRMLRPRHDPATATISAPAAQAGVWCLVQRRYETMRRRRGGEAMSDAAASDAAMSNAESAKA
jgi:hypothetical protein